MVGFVENAANRAANRDMRVKTAKNQKTKKYIKGMVKNLILLKVSKVCLLFSKALQAVVGILLFVPCYAVDILGLVFSIVWVGACILGEAFLYAFRCNIENDIEMYDFWYNEYRFRKDYHSYRW